MTQNTNAIALENQIDYCNRKYELTSTCFRRGLHPDLLNKLKVLFGHLHLFYQRCHYLFIDQMFDGHLKRLCQRFIEILARQRIFTICSFRQPKFVWIISIISRWLTVDDSMYALNLSFFPKDVGRFRSRWVRAFIQRPKQKLLGNHMNLCLPLTIQLTKQLTSLLLLFTEHWHRRIKSESKQYKTSYPADSVHCHNRWYDIVNTKQKHRDVHKDTANNDYDVHQIKWVADLPENNKN